MTNKRLLLMWVAVLVAIASGPALAAANLHDATGTYDGLLDLIRNSSNQWSHTLRGYAINLFWSLTAISMIWTFGQLVLKQAEFGEIAGEIVRFVLVTGVFYTLMIYSVDIGSAIVNSFRQAGATAAGVGVGLRPGDMFGLGVELAKTLTFPTINPALALQSGISGLIILLCFAFIAAFMGITLIEAYVVINISVLMMAFGGSQWTREYALAMWRGAIAVGVKLMVLTLIVGLVMNSAKDWQRLYTQDDASSFVILGIAFAAALMCKIIPDMMANLISGVSPGGGGVIGGMAAAGMAFGAGVAATMASQFGTGGVLGGIGQSLGGVADSLKGGNAGGPSGRGGSGGGAAFMNSMSGGGGVPAGPGPRVGGGGRGHSAPPPPPRPGGGSSSTNANASSGAQKSGGMSTGEKIHVAADTAVRTAGAAVSVAIPGAESASSLSVGSPPVPPESVVETPENIIRPDTSGSHSDRDENINRPEAKDWYDDNNNLTMAGLQEQLNNKGKS